MENDNEPEVIRQRMEETRTALTEKVERLEGQLTGLVSVGTEAVTETIASVKDTVADVTDAVQEKVQSVKEVFDLRLQMERHPLLLLGGSVALGFLASRLLRSAGGAMSAAGHAVSAVGHAAMAAAPAVKALVSEPPPTPAPTPAKAKDEPKPKGESFVGEALGQVKNLALGSVMAMIREMATAHLPNDFGKQVADTVDGLTHKLGVQPMASPIDLKGDDKPEENESQEEPAKAGGKPGRNRKPAASRN